VSLKKVLNMEKESGEKSLTHKIAILTKEATKMTRKMEWGHLFGKVVTHTRAVIKMMKDTVSERCSGLMAHAIRVNGKKEFNMESVEWSFRMEGSKKESLKTMYLKGLQNHL
jgi:hypothetical protein